MPQQNNVILVLFSSEQLHNNTRSSGRKANNPKKTKIRKKM